MNRVELQSILQNPYDRDNWRDTLRSVLPASDLFASPQAVVTTKASEGSILQLGKVRLHDGRQLAILEVSTSERIDLSRNRVGLRGLVVRLIDQAEYHGILALFHRQDSREYRFTFAARESVFDAEGNFTRRETAPRRYTYVLGPTETCRTAAERFELLAAKGHGAVLNDVIDAFSVDKLTSTRLRHHARQSALCPSSDANEDRPRSGSLLPASLLLDEEGQLRCFSGLRRTRSRTARPTQRSTWLHPSA